jgi:hypothetical protein
VVVGDYDESGLYELRSPKHRSCLWGAAEVHYDEGDAVRGRFDTLVLTEATEIFLRNARFLIGIIS